jgi:dihydrofolate synthase/folylpolyglutamate synthase
MGAPYAGLLARLQAARGLGVELGLGHVRDALARVGDPQRRFAAVQIAGTNGKGSTAAMTEAILRRAGLRTGLYTSPHLARFTERLRIDGREIDGDRLAGFDPAVVATGVPLTYFEIATVLAFLAMADAGVDVGVLETGLGGRLDAVTAAEPLATAITSIGLDHQGYLGDTLPAIAREKAGILKPGIPCFLGRLPPEADAEIAGVARAVGAPLARLGRDYEPPAAAPALGGPHQRANAALAVALARAAAGRLGRPLDEAAVAGGLADVSWPGRLEAIGGDVLLDCAHNEEGARALAAALAESAAGRRTILVASIVSDKDPRAILAALAPRAAAVVLTRAANPRVRPPEELARVAGELFAEVVTRPDPEDALVEARRLAGPGGVVVVCGSIFLVGELRARLLGEPVDPEPTSDPVERGAGGRLRTPPR